MIEYLIIGFLVVVAIAGLIICDQLDKELKNIFSEENIYRESAEMKDLLTKSL